MLLGVAEALYLAALVGALGWALRAHGVGPWAREAALLLVLYAIWQEGLILGVVHIAGAVTRGMDIWRAERWLHLPSERAVEHAVLRQPTLMRALNRYYEFVHVEDVIGCLLWLFWGHRDRYRSARNSLAVMTLATMVLQFIPVAPPRLIPATGVVDAGRLLGQAVYHLDGLHDPTQLTAMPSVHMAWATWVAVVVIASSTSRWRWLILAHPILTVLSVVVPGYHFWADPVVAVGIVALTFSALHRLAHRKSHRARRAPQRSDAPLHWVKQNRPRGVDELDPVHE